jgi:hypothetical protein
MHAGQDALESNFPGANPAVLMAETADGKSPKTVSVTETARCHTLLSAYALRCGVVYATNHTANSNADTSTRVGREVRTTTASHCVGGTRRPDLPMTVRST